MKYVITAINRLTGEREPISAPRSLRCTERLLAKKQEDFEKEPAAAWSDLKIRRCPKVNKE